MNQEQLDQKIAESTCERITQEDIDRKIESVAYFILPGTNVTICHLVLKNGFSVRGESACVDPRNFRQEIGEELAFKKAEARVWELEGYLLAERRYLNRLYQEQEEKQMG